MKFKPTFVIRLLATLIIIIVFAKILEGLAFQLIIGLGALLIFVWTFVVDKKLDAKKD